MQMARMTVNAMHDLIEDRRATCYDETAVSRSMEFHGECRVDFQPQSSASALFSKVGLPRGTGYLTDHAFKQLADRFGVPPSWVMDGDKCPNDLRKLVLDWKFANEDERNLLLRLTSDPDGDPLRAVLSDRYQPYDHHDLWSAVEAAVAQMPAEPWVLPRGGMGDELRGYIVRDGVQFDGFRPPNRSGDGGGSGGLQPAVYFSNSEIGTGRVRITAGLYRGFCDNGVIYGWKEQGSLAVTHLWSQKNHIALAVHEGIANAMNLSEEAAGRMLQAMDLRVEPTKLASIFDRWAGEYGVTIASKDAWKALVSPEPTVFDMVNAATVLAQKADTAEAGENLERMAGDMLANMTDGPRR